VIWPRSICSLQEV